MTFREEIIGDCRLILGDCRDVLPSLCNVDHVISDPPYEKEAHRTMRRTQKSIREGVNDDIVFAAITEEERAHAAANAVRLSKGWVMFFCQAEAAGAWRDAIEAADGKYKRTMIWVKPDSSPQFNGQMPAMGYESISLAWCGEGHPRWNGGGRRGVFTHLTNQLDRHGVHQTEKPVPLMRELVSLFTNPGEIVLDFFMGVGTTGVACAKLGRKFIGIEIDPRYFEIACKRISDAYAQPDMFRDFAEKPRKQEALL